jgi:hypothetical protein
MSCQQCGIVEPFKESSKCDIQKSMNNCLYAANGLFICISDKDTTEKLTNTQNYNKYMELSAYDNKNVAQYSLPL